ncbi:hypothetical protein MTR67_012821, partial [Solanum verrucosum]
MLKAKA